MDFHKGGLDINICHFYILSESYGRGLGPHVRNWFEFGAYVKKKIFDFSLFTQNYDFFSSELWLFTQNYDFFSLSEFWLFTQNSNFFLSQRVKS